MTLRRSIRRAFDLDYEPPTDPPPAFAKIDSVRIDHSVFHDLMHPIWSSYCVTMPGGRRNHASLWWHYIGAPKVMTTLLCPLGFHEYTRVWNVKDGVQQNSEVRCRNCMWLRGDHNRSRKRPDHWRNR